MDVGQELLQWLINQGVAVAFAIFVLVRLDTRVGELLLSMQNFIDEWGKANSPRS